MVLGPRMSLFQTGPCMFGVDLCCSKLATISFRRLLQQQVALYIPRRFQAASGTANRNKERGGGGVVNRSGFVTGSVFVTTSRFVYGSGFVTLWIRFRNFITVTFPTAANRALYYCTTANCQRRLEIFCNQPKLR
jgi:hypothetical protein